MSVVLCLLLTNIFLYIYSCLFVTLLMSFCDDFLGNGMPFETFLLYF